MNKFKVGDKVICTYAHNKHVTEGETYEIVRSTGSGYCYVTSDFSGRDCVIVNSRFILKEKRMNEMPKLEAGKYFKCGDRKYVSINPKVESGKLYGCIEIIKDTFSDGNAGPVCGVTYSVELASVTEVFKTCTHKIAMCPDQWLESIWQKESATDKAIRDLKELQAEANAEFESKIKELEDSLK